MDEKENPSVRTKRVVTALTWVAPLLLPFLLFGFRLGGEFIWDDIDFVRDCAPIHAREGWASLFKLQLCDNVPMDRYHPIPMLSLWLQMRASESIAWLRFGNVVLQVLNVLLFAKVLERLGVRERIRCFAALLFAVHPLTVEPVMLITGRHDTITVAFMLGALLVGPLRPGAWPSATLIGLTTKRDWTLARVLGMSSLVFFACISKETAFVLPVFLLFAMFSEAVATGVRPRATLLFAGAVVGPFLALSAVIVIRRSLDIHSSTGVSRAPFIEKLQTFGTLVAGYAHYVILCTHGATTRVFEALDKGPAFVTLLVTAAIVAAGLALLRRARRTDDAGAARVRVVRGLFGVGWFLLAVAPYVVAVVVTGRWGNRYGYLAVMGVLIALSSIIEQLFLVVPSRLRPVAALAGLVPFGYATIDSLLATADWRDGVSLFSADVEQDPSNPYAMSNLGLSIAGKLGCKPALVTLQRAVELDPKNIGSVRNAAICFAEVGRLKEAEQYSMQEVELLPNNASAYVALADVRMRLGKPAAARAAVQAGLKVQPNSPELQQIGHAIERASVPPPAAKQP